MVGVIFLAAFGVPAAAAPAPHDVVLQWNDVLLQAIRADRTPPPLAARNLAIAHAAIYDAVNTIQLTHQPYAVRATPAAGASADIAAAVAAHRILAALYPAQIARFDEALDRCCEAVPDGPAKEDGVALGHRVAERLLELRDRDGAGRKVSYTPARGPGLWQPTPPDFRPALLPQWPSVTCFAMRDGGQFRPRPPPALTSAAYTAAFREVKALGGRDSAARTAEQTEIARFWADGDGTATPPGHWNQIAQDVARARGLTMPENARLFALLNLALADAAIVAWDCKFAFHVWRPVQAIREADADGNPDTDPDRDWTPLLPTPPFPSYTSGHSTFSAAAAAVLAAYFGGDRVPFTTTSEGLPGVRRSFGGFWAASEEAGRSRIYGGIHWEFDNAEGLASGRRLGEYVADGFLLPRAADPLPAGRP